MTALPLGAWGKPPSPPIFKVAYVTGGWQTTDSGIGYVVRSDSGAIAAASGNDAAVQVQVDVTVSYSGPPLGPNDAYFLKITPVSSATAVGGTAAVSAVDSLSDPSLQTALQGGENVVLTGEGLQKITLDSSGKMHVTLTAAAAASATGTGATTAAVAGFKCEVTMRGMAVGCTNPSLTYYRPPGGGAPIANAPDPNTGQVRVDIGCIQSESYWGWLLDWGLAFFAGGTAGSGWVYPLLGMEWQGFDQSEDMVITDINLATGQSEARWLYEEHPTNEADLAARLKKWFDGCWGPFPIALFAWDSVGKESKCFLLCCHGPLEKTADSWEDTYTGNLDQCTSVGSAFKPGYLGAVQNDTDRPGSLDVKCERTAEVTDGVTTDPGLRITVGIKDMLALEYGPTESHSTVKIYKIGQELGFVATVDPGQTVEADWRYWGTAEFPVASQWNAVGYDGDTNLTYVKITKFILWVHVLEGSGDD